MIVYCICTQVVEHLLGHGADSTHRCIDGWLPVHAAAEKNNVLCLQHILREKPQELRDLASDKGETALHVAARLANVYGAFPRKVDLHRFHL